MTTTTDTPTNDESPDELSLRVSALLLTLVRQLGRGDVDDDVRGDLEQIRHYLGFLLADDLEEEEAEARSSVLDDLDALDDQGELYDPHALPPWLTLAMRET